MADGKTIPPERTVIVIPHTDRRRRGPTDDVIRQLAVIVGEGNYSYIACDIVGVPSTTFSRWMKRGEEDETAGFTIDNSPYMNLWATMKRARASAQRVMVNVITSTAVAKHDGYLAHTFLERTDPARWARRDRKAAEEIDDEQVPITRIEVVRPAPQVDSPAKETTE